METDMLIRESFALLGFKVRDKVTGFKGVVTAIEFDLYGCIMAIVQPEVSPDGKVQEGRWFDTKRLLVIDRNAVMEQPKFVEVPGPAEKPQLPESPLAR